jgi:L-xylulose reductase
MSKAALEMMSNLLAVELGPHHIRVNTVRPACVDTDLLNVAETGVGSVMGGEDAFKSFMVGRTPYPGYHMEMEELVNLILFSLSDLTKQMTGTVLTMDGGFQLT